MLFKPYLLLIFLIINLTYGTLTPEKKKEKQKVKEKKVVETPGKVEKFVKDVSLNIYFLNRLA